MRLASLLTIGLCASGIEKNIVDALVRMVHVRRAAEATNLRHAFTALRPQHASPKHTYG